MTKTYNQMTPDEQKLYDDKKNAESKYNNLKYVLRDLFETLEFIVLGLRFILYVGSVAGSWFYLKDKVLAVAIATSLTVAHLLIVLMEYIRAKKDKLLED